MQETRSTMLSSSETYPAGADSSNLVMDQHNLLPNPLQSQNFPHFLLNADDAQMLNGNIIGQQNVDLNLWNSGASSSVKGLVNDGSFFEAERGHLGPSSSTARGDSTSSLPLQNLDFDLNLNHVDQSDAENANCSHDNVGSGLNALPANPGFCPSEFVSYSGNSSSGIGSSSQSFNLLEHRSGKQVALPDGRRSSGKRKNIHGNPVQCTTTGSSSNSQQSRNYLSTAAAHESVASLTFPISANYVVPCPPGEQLHQVTDIFTSPSSSDHSLFPTEPSRAESFLRNTRIRLSPNQHDIPVPNLSSEGSVIGHSNYQRVQLQQPSPFFPVHQLTQPRVISTGSISYNRPILPRVTQFSQNLHHAQSNGILNPIIGRTSSAAEIVGQASTTNEPNRSSLRTLPEPQMFSVPVNASNTVQGSTNLHVARRGRSSVRSSSFAARGVVNAGTQQMLGLNVLTQQNASTGGSNISTQQSASTRGLPAILQSSFSSAVTESQSPEIALQQHGYSSALHQIRNSRPGSGSRAHQQSYLRAISSIDRQNTLVNVLRTIAGTREGRSRILSELPNVLDQIQLGSNSRFEDLFAVDRSVLFRRVNLVDRHRDMRLDVDNMSYEELLALGERIGYVNTGLSEEKIVGSLKQWKYMVESSSAVEPCCICQEDYVEGDDMGKLDCGHEFHTACIKQWLIIKNMCPICKKTGLEK